MQQVLWSCHPDQVAMDAAPVVFLGPQAAFLQPLPEFKVRGCQSSSSTRHTPHDDKML
jgi:hypothetical protein